MSDASCWVICTRDGIIQGIDGEPTCFPTQGDAHDVVKAAGPVALLTMLVVPDPGCERHATPADVDLLTCSGCHREYDPSEGEDEIFCSEDCRRDEAQAALR